MEIHDHAKDLKTADTMAWQIIKPDGPVLEKKEEVIAEQFIEVSVNGIRAFILSCTPMHLTELVVGRLYTEGMIDDLDDIKSLFICGEGTIAEVVLVENREFQPFSGAEPSCCTSNRQYLDGARKLSKLPDVPVEPKAVFELAEKFSGDGKLHKSTGAAHSCYIRFGDGRIAAFEDIGRHNALDKAVGHMLLEGEDAAGAMLFTTGRVAADMVLKTVAAGIPVLASKSAATTKALLLAEEYGLKLICRAWPDSFYIPVYGD